MPASMPARKLRSLRYTQRLLTMSSILRPRFLWKAIRARPGPWPGRDCRAWHSRRRPRPAAAPAVERDVAIQHRQQALAVGRIAGLDHQVEDQAAPAGGQIELVAVVHVAAALDDDIGVRLEQADQLLAGRHRLAGQHPPLGLRDDPLDQRQIVSQLARQSSPPRDVGGMPSWPLRRRLLQMAKVARVACDQLAVQLTRRGRRGCIGCQRTLLGRRR